MRVSREKVAMAAKPAVLVIDDDDDVRATLCVLLEQDGYQASAAASGEEALQQAGETRFDVVCCDLHLADGMDGYALAATLRSRLPEARFLALTGDASARLGELTGPGFAAVLVKPIDYNALLAAISSP